MADIISGIITLKQFFEATESIIGYAEPGDEEEVYKWTLRTNRKYEVPAYQREIRWTENNVLALVDDIYNTERKFLGNIILSTENRTVYEIIDGQQRISVILMLLECVKQKVTDRKNSIDVCIFENKSFENFYSALQNNFADKDTTQYIEQDVLNQSKAFEILWNYINTIFPEDDETLKRFERKLLSAKINLIITSVGPHDDEGRRLCVDYFIDINNKGKHLDSSDILKAYAFRANYVQISHDWIEVQKKEKQQAFVYYPKESMFLHYFMCCVNSVLEVNRGIRLKGLSADYELVQNVSIDQRTYTKGTKVEELITSDMFYETMFSNIIKFQDFINKTIACVGGAPDAEFTNLFHATDGTINMVSIKNYFKIINGILRNSDIVPKILLMKFFIEVMNNANSIKDDYKVLYDINVVAIVFSAGNGNAKQLSSFANLVMSKNWDILLSRRAQKALKKFPQNIKFAKEVQYINKPIPTSGQFLAHRVCGLTTAYTLDGNGKFEINEQMYNDYLYANLINDEHLIIPQKLKIHFQYRGEFIENKPIHLSEKYISQMSYLANYLVIKREINDNLKTYNIKEKIRIIDEYLNDGLGDVFADKISQKLFYKVKEIFGETVCPTQEEIDAADSPECAKELIAAYYSNYFENDFQNYIRSIIPEELFSWNG